MVSELAGLSSGATQARSASEEIGGLEFSSLARRACSAFAIRIPNSSRPQRWYNVPMLDFFSDDIRRDPFPLFSRARSIAPVVHVPPPFDAWVVLDYEGVKRVLFDHASFSNAVPAPRNWFIFSDPPVHTKLRGLISRAFTPRIVTSLEPRIRTLSRELLKPALERGEIDLATEYSVPLAMKVISEMIGIPPSDWSRFHRWSDGILAISQMRMGDAAKAAATAEFESVAREMDDYLREMIAVRRQAPADDLLTKLVEAEVDGQSLSHDEILGFFQLLVVGGQETTANLINNAVLSFIEHPDQLARLRESPDLLPSAIEEVLRYRSPLTWVMRTPARDVELHGQLLKPRQLILPMIGSANRDERQFRDAAHFDISREPNPHLGFGTGIHACLGSALARLEARIALTDILATMSEFQLATSDPWPPRRALNVHGPASLPIRFTP